MAELATEAAIDVTGKREKIQTISKHRDSVCFLYMPYIYWHGGR